MGNSFVLAMGTIQCFKEVNYAAGACLSISVRGAGNLTCQTAHKPKCAWLPKGLTKPGMSSGQGSGGSCFTLSASATPD